MGAWRAAVAESQDALDAGWYHAGGCLCVAVGWRELASRSPLHGGTESRHARGRSGRVGRGRQVGRGAGRVVDCGVTAVRNGEGTSWQTKDANKNPIKWSTPLGQKLRARTAQGPAAERNPDAHRDTRPQHA